MIYIQVRWVNAPPGEAVMWFSEIGGDGYEVRKVVIFADGYSERADANAGTEYCRLGVWDLAPAGTVPNGGWGWGASERPGRDVGQRSTSP